MKVVFQGMRLKNVRYFRLRAIFFKFGKKFLIAVTPLYQKKLKSRFRGNLNEDPPGPLK